MIIRALSPSPIGVADLARLTGASPVTIRRDLTDLEGQGLLRRVHGGALAPDKRGNPMPYAARAAENREAKTALAAVAAGLVRDDESVVLDDGSTLVEVAHALTGRPLVVTCLSLHAAVALADSPTTTVVVPGGRVTTGTLAPTPAAATALLHDVRADVALLGACSASPAHGLTASTWDDAVVKRAVVACAARRVLVTTGDKLARTSTFRYADLEDLHDLVTTADAPAPALEEVRAAGVRVHLAG